MTSTGRPTQKSFYTNAVGAKRVEAGLVNLQLHNIKVGLVFCDHRRSVELASSLRVLCWQDPPVCLRRGRYFRLLRLLEYLPRKVFDTTE
jgi:hypothetical protein